MTDTHRCPSDKRIIWRSTRTRKSGAPVNFALGTKTMAESDFDLHLED